MLLAAAVFLFSAGYYVLIWQPLSERIEQQETMLQQLVAMNTRLKSAAPDIIAARKSATTTPAQVSRVISDSASAHSVVIKRIAERGENIQVWIEPVVFNDLLIWLNALDEKYALRVTQIDVSAAEKPDGECAAAGVDKRISVPVNSLPVKFSPKGECIIFLSTHRVKYFCNKKYPTSAITECSAKRQIRVLS